MHGATSELAAVVLAGGRSSRMGLDKATAPFRGRRMIDEVVGRLREITSEILVAARDRQALEPLDARVLEDAQAYAGPLPALTAGIQATGARRVIAVACDMPFLNTELLASLADRLDDRTDAVVPITEHGPEPLHAVYGDRAIEPLLAALAAGERSLRRAIEGLRVRWVRAEEWKIIDPSGRSFWNLNTPAEYAEAALEAR